MEMKALLSSYNPTNLTRTAFVSLDPTAVSTVTPDRVDIQLKTNLPLVNDGNNSPAGVAQ